MNPVLEAIENDDLETFSRLVGNDEALRNGPNAFGSWLHYASFLGRLPFVKYLVEHGADVNLRAGTSDAGPITEAASYGHLHVIDYLLKHGAELDVSTPTTNPMFAAICDDNVAVARFLLNAGVDCHVVYRGLNGKLRNALSYAQEPGHNKEIVDLLNKAGCRLPVEGVDQPVWEPEKNDEPTTSDRIADRPVREPEEIYEPTINDRVHNQLVARMAEAFGPVDRLAQREIFPGHATVHVEIHMIRPNDQNQCLTLFTTGMSDQAMRVPKGQEEYAYAELMMHLPPTWPHPRDESAGKDTFWPFEWLRKVAYYPHLNDTWLGGSMTIISSDEPPVPLGPNTKQTCLLLLANLGDWGPIPVEGGKKVQIYTVVPVYTEERDFEIEHGIVPLLRRLEERGFTSVVNVDRPNVALG